MTGPARAPESRAPAAEGHERPLTEADTRPLIERAARRGSVSALKMMQEFH